MSMCTKCLLKKESDWERDMADLPALAYRRPMTKRELKRAEKQVVHGQQNVKYIAGAFP